MGERDRQREKRRRGENEFSLQSIQGVSLGMMVFTVAGLVHNEINWCLNTLHTYLWV